METILVSVTQIDAELVRTNQLTVVNDVGAASCVDKTPSGVGAVIDPRAIIAVDCSLASDGHGAQVLEVAGALYAH